MPGLALGVDLGGSNVRALLVGPAGDALAERSAATAPGGARAVVTQLVEISRGLAEDAERAWEEVDRGAVGVPGVPQGGRLRLAPNLPPFDGLDLAAELRAGLGIPVELENDANVAALAEARRGVGAGRSDFVFVSVGTGVGMGIVAGGRLLRGAMGAAGEIGTMLVGPAQLELEALAGGAGMARRYARSGRRLTAAEIFAAAAAGEEEAGAAVHEHARAVAR